MRQLDRRAATEYGIHEQLLMENAGESAAITLLNQFDKHADSFLVVCGAGNNGGDGLVVARKLHSNQLPVRVVIFGDPEKYGGAALQNFRITQKINLEIAVNPKIKTFRQMISEAAVLIDALFGTGIDREISGIYREIITEINVCQKPVVSLDIPSGVNGDTGEIMGTCVNASMTVTFGLPKYGNLLYPGFQHGGQLYLTHISFPPEMYMHKEFIVETNDPIKLPGRAGDAHKGICGKVLFIAGAANYLGAPYLAAGTFLRTGGGLAYLATPEQVAPFIGAGGHEIVFVPQIQTDTGSIARVNLETLLAFSEQVDMVVIGPGLSLHPETQQLVRDIAVAVKKPLLVDGDGLTAIAQNPELLRKRTASTILTPHPGEMARLVGTDKPGYAENKISLVQQQARRLNSILVLKGAHSLIGYPDGKIYINMSGNAGMATAGSGDVLTGVIAGLYGIGYGIETAVRMGVFIHGAAGDIAAEKTGEDGLIAGDIMAAVPQTMKRMRESFDQLNEIYKRKIRLI